MRLLLVEDQPEHVALLQGELEDAGVVAEIDVAASRGAAERMLAQEGRYDVIVCDLRIPTEDGELDSDVEHGLGAFGHARRVSPGTPIIVLSAHSNNDVSEMLLDQGDRQDPFGSTSTFPMVDFVQKHKLEKCAKKLAAAAKAVAELKTIEVSEGANPINLSADDRRLIKVFARRRGGAVAKVSSLKAGFSGARVYRVRVEDSQGGFRSSVLAKLTGLRWIADEEDRYLQHVASALPHGSFTLLADKVVVGAHAEGGLFYTLLEDYDRNLFDVLEADPSEAAAVVYDLSQRLSRWRQGAVASATTVGDVRRSLLPDSTIQELEAYTDRADHWDAVEQTPIQTRTCSEHRDLHGENVLINAKGEAVLIDFGSAGAGCASLDPVTLELSSFLHPESPAPPAWLDVAAARAWPDLGAYTGGQERAAFASACRTWASDSAAGYNEVCAIAYSYAFRQLQYRNDRSGLALAVVEGTAAKLLSS